MLKIGLKKQRYIRIYHEHKEIEDRHQVKLKVEEVTLVQETSFPLQS